MKKHGIISYEDKFDAVKMFLDRVDKDPKSFPKQAVVLALEDEEISKIFTKERLRLIRTIRKRNPKSIRELAELVEREDSAVDRDIKLLEGFDIVKLEKKGRTVMPIVEKTILMLSLGKIEKLDASEHIREKIPVSSGRN